MALSTDSSENKIPEVANDALRASFLNAIAGGTVLFVKEGRVFRQEQTGNAVAVKTLSRRNITVVDALLKSKVLKRKRQHEKDTVEA